MSEGHREWTLARAQLEGWWSYPVLTSSAQTRQSWLQVPGKQLGQASYCLGYMPLGGHASIFDSWREVKWIWLMIAHAFTSTLPTPNYKAQFRPSPFPASCFLFPENLLWDPHFSIFTDKAYKVPETCLDYSSCWINTDVNSITMFTSSSVFL